VSAQPIDERVLKTGEAVAQSLRGRIARGELAAGDRLPPEDELMDHFGVARTTLREGLRILESQGLIAIQRGRHGGPRVTTPPIERVAQGFALHLQLGHTTIGDLDEARQLIEPALAGRLARRRAEDDLDALAKAIHLAEKAASRGDVRGFGEAAAAVHMTIVERGGNQTLALVAQMLHEVVGQYYALAAKRSTKPLLDRAVRSYRKLLRLVEAGDERGAAEHWQKQMKFTIDRSDRNRALQLFERSADGV
jgi:GntR family transcriptional regulator, transcriptional repressor for pyruvate dehydrogenase complex